MAEEDLPKEVYTRYAKVKDQIAKAIIRSSADPFFRSSLENLQKTMCSMEPVVDDMNQSGKASPHYTFMTNKFLPLLEQVEDCIPRFLEIELPAASSRVGTRTASICRAFGIELPSSSTLAISCKNDLEIIRERLKELYADYVRGELDKLALSNQEMADEELLELLRYLLLMIRHEASKPSPTPVFLKIKLILDSLETEFHSRRHQSSTSHISPPAPSNMPRLLHLLKEVKLLYRFLNGDHGLDIPNHLQESEYALRKFVADDLVSRLSAIDRHHRRLQKDKERGKEISHTVMFLLIAVLMFACELDKPEYPNRPSEFVTISVVGIFVVLLAYYLVKQVFTRVSLRQSHAQRESSKSNNPRCGVFQLQILAAVVVAIVIAVAMAVTGEPRKYDIFLNFRGSEEIRYSVVGVLQTSLKNANISSFFDERDLCKTKKFITEINSAINNSVAAVTIFSEDYGESGWCLDELLLILEREKTYEGYMIRPIFYKLKPDDLTDPESKFGQGLQELYKTKPKEKVEEWKEALEYVISISGDLYKSDQHLDVLVGKIVEDFKKELGNKRSMKINTIRQLRSLIVKVTQVITQIFKELKPFTNLMNRFV